MLSHLTIVEVGVVALALLVGFVAGVLWKGFTYVNVKFRDKA